MIPDLEELVVKLSSRIDDLESVIVEDRKKIRELVEKYEPGNAWWKDIKDT